MRTIAAATLVAISALSIAAVGCGGSDSETITGGDGGSGATGAAGPGAAGPGGSGGSGGQPCVPSPEICDGLDNNCDGAVDEPPCNCKEGTSQDCYSGRPATKDVGQCVGGTQTCDGAGSWGACVGEVTPKAEECNGKDDDCNGAVDDMGDTTCGVGACQVTVPKCANGQTNACTPAQPSLEICDGIDNDCDQQTDESFPNANSACSTGNSGVCGPGKLQCIAGVETCVADSTGSPEICDGLDNDCSGVVDDNIPGTGGMCSTGYPGPCSPGTISCQNGVIDCFPLVSPSAEVCDGIDNDCDGTVDQNDIQGGGVCDTGQLGECAPGIEHCLGGSIQCVPNKMSQAEVCDGLDNDCDGQVDQGDPGGNVSCLTGLPGVCSAGTKHCQNGALVCVQNTQSSPEVCDGLDNNCSGAVDEGNPGGGASCNTGLLGVCAPGTITCQNAQLSCKQNVQPSPEICGNATDENCDGIVAGAATNYFTDDFGAGNIKGWTLGPEWSIGSTVASTCVACPGGDPATDHTATADNGVAGVLIGSCTGAAVHADYCITSPVMNTTTAPGAAYVSFWRHLHSDYPSFMNDHVDVSTNGGVSWTPVWSNPANGTCINDAAWAKQTYDVTTYKSANFRLRICYNIGSTGVYASGSWSVDDLAVATCQ